MAGASGKCHSGIQARREDIQQLVEKNTNVLTTSVNEPVRNG